MTLRYDLESDPHELRNLAEENESERIRRLREELYAGLDVERLRADIVASQAWRLALRDLHEGHQPAWDYQPFFDAAVRYIRPSRGS